MPVRKTYADHGDACRTAHAMELIADHWAYVVIRELFLGPKRFTDLQSSAHGITPAVLTTRLRDLEARGILAPRTLDPPARVTVYQLTAWGLELEPIMHALGRWAQQSPTAPTSGDLTPDAAVLAMRSMVPGARLTPGTRVQLHLFDERGRQRLGYDYALECDDRGLRVERGHMERPVVQITAAATDWAAAVFDGARLPEGTVSGDATALVRLLESTRREAAANTGGDSNAMSSNN